MRQGVAPLLAFAIAWLGLAAPVRAGEFLLAISDVPLADGLSEQPDPLVFESDQGRVVRTLAEGSVGAGAVADFYAASLPALGWRPEGGGGLSFIRENEHLTITLAPADGPLFLSVRFELVVRTAALRLPEEAEAGSPSAGDPS